MARSRPLVENVFTLKDTYLKASTATSATLPAESKVYIPARTMVAVSKNAEIDGHWQVTTTYLGKKYDNWYLFAAHITPSLLPGGLHVGSYVPPSPSSADNNLSHLQPKFEAKMRALISKCAENGIVLYINEGLRSFKRQAFLYAQGRTRKGAVVTHAPAGTSNHHWGLAVDCYPKIKGKVVYNFDQVPGAMRQMEKVYDIAESLGIKCGARGATGSFVDLPHLQDGALLRVSEMRKLYPQGYIPGKSRAL